MLDLMAQHFFQNCRNIRIQPACDGDLGAINTDRAVFAGMVDLDDTGNGQRIARLACRFAGQRSIGQRNPKLSLYGGYDRGFSFSGS